MAEAYSYPIGDIDQSGVFTFFGDFVSNTHGVGSRYQSINEGTGFYNDSDYVYGQFEYSSGIDLLADAYYMQNPLVSIVDTIYWQHRSKLDTYGDAVSLNVILSRSGYGGGSWSIIGNKSVTNLITSYPDFTTYTDVLDPVGGVYPTFGPNDGFAVNLAYDIGSENTQKVYLSGFELVFSGGGNVEYDCGLYIQCNEPSGIENYTELYINSNEPSGIENILDLSINGDIDINNNMDLFLYTNNSITNASRNINLYTVNTIDMSGSTDLFIRSIQKSHKSMDMFLQSNTLSLSNNNLPLFINSSIENSIFDSINLYTKSTGTSDMCYLYLEASGQLFANSSIPIYLDGGGFSNNNVNLVLQSLRDSNSNVKLFINGYGDIPNAFVSRNSIPLFIGDDKNIDINHINLYLDGAKIGSGQLSLVTSGGNLETSQVPLFMEAQQQDKSGQLHLYVHGF